MQGKSRGHTGGIKKVLAIFVHYAGIFTCLEAEVSQQHSPGLANAGISVNRASAWSAVAQRSPTCPDNRCGRTSALLNVTSVHLLNDVKAITVAVHHSGPAGNCTQERRGRRWFKSLLRLERQASLGTTPLKDGRPSFRGVTRISLLRMQQPDQVAPITCGSSMNTSVASGFLQTRGRARPAIDDEYHADRLAASAHMTSGCAFMLASVRSCLSAPRSKVHPREVRFSRFGKRTPGLQILLRKECIRNRRAK